MADEAQNITSEDSSNEVSLPDNVSTDAVLSGIFAGQDVEIPEIEEEKPEEETPPVETTAQDSELISLRERLEKLQEKQTELETANNILRYQQSRQQPQVQEPQEEEFDINKFREAVAKDPAGAIFDLFQKSKDAGQSIKDQAAKQASEAALSVVSRQQAYESDRATVTAEFGELLNTNEKFNTLANQIYNQLVSDAPEFSTPRGAVKYRNGALYQAAAIAYAQMHKAGQLTNPNPKVVQLHERKPKPQNPIVGEQGSDKPKTVASDIPAKDLAIMARTAKGMGMPLERYLQVVEELKKRDPHYGT